MTGIPDMTDEDTRPASVGGDAGRGPGHHDAGGSTLTEGLPRPYARCGVCGGVYRPDAQASLEAHEAAQGHPPRPHEHDHPAQRRTTAARLLIHAAATVGRLQDELDAEYARRELLGQLAQAWADTDSGDLHEAARQVRGVLARPAVFAQDDDADRVDVDVPEGDDRAQA